jgi:hypothetical protein
MSLSFRSLSRACLLVIAAAVASCRDEPTSPGRTLSLSPSAPLATITVLGTATLDVPPENDPSSGGLPANWIDGGGVPVHSSGIQIPPGSSYRVKVSGRITASQNPDFAPTCSLGASFPDEGSYGPAGTGNAGHELHVYLALQENGGVVREIQSFYAEQTGKFAPDSAMSDFIYSAAGGTLLVGRAGMWGVCMDNSTGAHEGKYLLSGSQTVTVETYNEVLKLTAAPSYIKSGTPVTFTARRSDGGTNVTIWAWHWSKDPGVTASGPSCPNSNPCLSGVNGSGTMSVDGIVNGHAYTASAHVTIYNGFALDADQASVYIGDTVVFTPRYDGIAGSAARWNWVPSDTASRDENCTDVTGPCAKLMIVSGRMWAYTDPTPGHGDSAFANVTVQLPTLSLSVDKSESGEGDTVTFTGTLSPARPAESMTWRWEAGGGGVAARRPVAVASVGTSTLRSRSERALTDQIAADDTLINSVNDDATVGAPADDAQTSACLESSLTCVTEMHGVGTMTLEVRLFGRVLTRSVESGVRYYCPEVIPTADGVAVADPIIIERSTGTYIISGTPHGSGTISFWGPYSRLQVTQIGNGGKYERARYRVGRGQDWDGDIVIPLPIPGGYRQLEGSWVEIECRVWLRDNGSYTGSLWPTGKHNANLVARNP